MEQVRIGAMIVGLLALYPAWLMFQKAFIMTRNRVGVALLTAVLPVLVTSICLAVPFLVHAGGQLKSHDFFIDFILFGICPAAVVGLGGFVWDQLHERPFKTVLSASGCLAVAVLPILFYFYAPSLQTRFEITTTESVTTIQDAEDQSFLPESAEPDSDMEAANQQAAIEDLDNETN